MRGTSLLRLPTTVLVDDEKQKITERYVPVGVCGCLNPWNIPMISVATKLAAALVAGNTVVIKPSPFTPLTTLRFGRDIQQLVPPGVVNILNGDNNLGPMMTTHPGIDKISFTGSSFTGQKVMESASNGLKAITLELGGNDPMILLPDVDPKALAPKIFWGTFLNSGQGCIAEYSKTIKVGNGLDPESQLGPIQNLAQYRKVLSYFEDAHANGYKFALGGDVNPNPTTGLYIPISILDNPPENSKIVREEPFGPIVPLLKWSNEEDVIKRANDTNLGLAASVWGKDTTTVERIALQIQAGTVTMNQFISFQPNTPFAGHKHSGIGVEGGIEGLKAYSNIQIVTLSKEPTP
ncbi:aldehyde dehydrogenase family protein [Ceratobasidium sp. AG-Ba]|nr:aldehyde dehydrogenase family protein [Ceratobasidium sp. AG-Ba]QRW13053.1 aldehyde dehydrogenase family protein [Ceratobasidium sp. AG-Ba]